jgi:DNA ligase D-like protein (predicted ligase)
MPVWIDPMLATLTEERFSDKNWIFEKKLDGIRGLAFRNGSSLSLLSRNKLSLNQSYPTIVRQLQKQKAQSFILDGEIVALEKGISSFEKLQQRFQKSTQVYYFVFDILFLNGKDCRQLPLIERKTLLKGSIEFDRTIRYVSYRIREGERYYQEACRRGWEGLIAKRGVSPYVSGRSRDWLKFKCSLNQEFVIVGYTDPEGQRTGFGALLVGYYEDQKLMFAGKVGTGYTRTTLQSLERQMSKMQRKTPAVTDAGLPKKNVHWIEPQLVAQVAFSEWTADHKLRHPRFLGLRTDKSASEVVRET